MSVGTTSPTGEPREPPPPRCKCILIGDPDVGKTCALLTFVNNGPPEQYDPSAIECYNVSMSYEQRMLNLTLQDTAGSASFDGLRVHAYAGAGLAVLFFSLADPASLARVRTRWAQEFRRYAPQDCALILAGTHADARNALAASAAPAGPTPPGTGSQASSLTPQACVTPEEGFNAAQDIGAARYVELCALLASDARALFNDVARVAAAIITCPQPRSRSSAGPSAAGPVQPRSRASPGTQQPAEDPMPLALASRKLPSQMSARGLVGREGEMGSGPLSPRGPAPPSPCAGAKSQLQLSPRALVDGADPAAAPSPLVGPIGAIDTSAVQGLSALDTARRSPRTAEQQAQQLLQLPQQQGARGRALRTPTIALGSDPASVQAMLLQSFDLVSESRVKQRFPAYVFRSLGSTPGRAMTWQQSSEFVMLVIKSEGARCMLRMYDTHGKPTGELCLQPDGLTFVQDSMRYFVVNTLDQGAIGLGFCSRPESTAFSLEYAQRNYQSKNFRGARRIFAKKHKALSGEELRAQLPQVCALNGPSAPASPAVVPSAPVVPLVPVVPADQKDSNKDGAASPPKKSGHPLLKFARKRTAAPEADANSCSSGDSCGGTGATARAALAVSPTGAPAACPSPPVAMAPVQAPRRYDEQRSANDIVSQGQAIELTRRRVVEAQEIRSWVALQNDRQRAIMRSARIEGFARERAAVQSTAALVRKRLPEILSRMELDGDRQHQFIGVSRRGRVQTPMCVSLSSSDSALLPLNTDAGAAAQCSAPPTPKPGGAIDAEELF